MADDRPVDDPASAIADLNARLTDISSTLLARVSRGMTGTIEPTLRRVAPSDALFVAGQTVLRATYPALWQWIQDQGLTPTPFGAGDGVTTFTLPDYRGKVAKGVFGAEVTGQFIGTDNPVLTLAMMPAHDHNVSVNNHGNHSHSGQTTHDYGHTGHFPGSSVITPSGSTWGVAAWNSEGNFNVPHTHDLQTDGSSAGSHTISESTMGSSSAIDVRQSSFGVNWMIWT